MATNIEETIPLNLAVANIQNNNQVGVFFNISSSIQTINRTGPSGNAALSVATLHEFDDIRIFLTNNALQSLGNVAQPVTTYDASHTNELYRLFLANWGLFHSDQVLDDDDYIEWSLVGENLIRKRQEFREQIDLYKTYDTQNHSMTRLLIEIIDYYIKEYLAKEENFSPEEIAKLERSFQQAINENNYLKYFIELYTMSNKFYRVLNRHLALYILDYFDIHNYSKGYRLMNCLVYIVTLVINHPNIDKHEYKGVTYRGLRMTEEALSQYSNGNHILNRSFVSTTANQKIAEIFAGTDQQDGSQQASNDHRLRKVPVLLKYTIKQNQTAIDIKHLSAIPDEEEILILPFSVFQVKDRIDVYSNTDLPVLIEIDLEECVDGEQKRIKNRKISSAIEYNVTVRCKGLYDL